MAPCFNRPTNNLVKSRITHFSCSIRPPTVNTRYITQADLKGFHKVEHHIMRCTTFEFQLCSNDVSHRNS